MTVASVSVVAVLVFLFGMFLLLYLNVAQLRATIASQIEIHAYLKPDLTEPETVALKQNIASLPEVVSVDYVSKEKAFRELETDLQNQVNLSGIINNPLPPYFAVKVSHPEKIADVAQAVRPMPGVAKVNYMQEIIDNFVALFKTTERFLFGMVIFLLGCALLLIHNTIRLGVFSRRREIEIMHLVGAGYGFIQWPFVLEGAFYGFVGAILAIFFLEPAYATLTNRMAHIFLSSPLIEGKNLWLLLFALTISGILVGTIGSFLSVKRTLRY